jgi:hypothetical protein
MGPSDVMSVLKKGNVLACTGIRSLDRPVCSRVTVTTDGRRVKLLKLRGMKSATNIIKGTSRSRLIII